MRSRTRRIVVDGTPYQYSLRHAHRAGADGKRVCEEVLRAWPEDRRHPALVLRFQDGAGGATTAGSGWGGHDGGVLVGAEHVNLHLPAVVAALLRAALRQGPPQQRPLELDGFALWRRRAR